MRELAAKATNARNDIEMEAVAISGNLSFPQLDCQSSTRMVADEDADIRRYAIICWHEISLVKLEIPIRWIESHSNQQKKDRVTFRCGKYQITENVYIFLTTPTHAIIVIFFLTMIHMLISAQDIWNSTMLSVSASYQEQHLATL